MSPDRDRRPRPEPGGGHTGTLAYHARMLADSERVSAYDRALRALVTPETTVLDAGAGTGLLSMLAARAGAARVYAVESMPVAELARELIAHNGLADRIELIHGDLRTLAPRAEVDLVVSDCMGRFLLDDHMMAAMDAAFGWLRQDGVVIPGALTLVVAPAEVRHFPALETFARPIRGIDLTPAAGAVEREVWAGQFEPAALLAGPQEFASWRLPGPAPVFDRRFAFTFARPGRLRALAGWFRATLAPGVTLETGPGFDTHWSQLLMPLPDTVVAPGDELELRLRLEGMLPEPLWSRAGTLRVGGENRSFALIPSVNADAPAAGAQRDRWRTQQGRSGWSADALSELGAELWVGGDQRRAAALFEDAAMALKPTEDNPGIWENVGIARHTRGDWVGAIDPLLRALDGDLTSREQSLRLLADACMRAHRQHNGARYLEIYQATFGPHPAGWSRSGADEAEGEER